jgi:D-psicose/D-tagatose/L-ribulose 3-epimerase
MLRIGVHALVFVSGWSAGEAARAVEAAARHGYDLLEIPLIDPRAIDADATARLLEEHGLGTVTSLALPPDADISSADSDCVARGEALLHDALAVSRDLGSAFMGGVLYSALRKYEKAATPDGWAGSVAVLAKLAGRAREMGITLGLEPVNRYESNLINTGQQALNFIAATGADNITLHLDSYHMNIEEGDVAGAIRRYRGRIGYVHVNESHRGYLGTGSIDFAAFFRALAEVGYDGAITFEAFSAGIGDPELANSLAVWRQLWVDTDDLAARARAFIDVEIAAARTAARSPSASPGSATSPESPGVPTCRGP